MNNAISSLILIIIPVVLCIDLHASNPSKSIVMALFDALDESNNHFITLPDLHKSEELFQGLEKLQILQLFESSDKNEDGKLSYVEFDQFAYQSGIFDKLQRINNIFTSNDGPSVPIPAISAEAHPAVLVPGLCASGLDNGASFLPRRYWVSLLDMLSGSYKENIGVKWEDGTIKSLKKVGVMQGLNGVSNLGDLGTIPYMKELIAALSPAGVGAATFDWRLVPLTSAIDAWIASLKTAVASVKKSDKKVFIIAHSLGNIMTMCLFNRTTEQAWVRDNIAGYIAVAPPFGGAGMTIEAILNGMVIEGVKIPPDFIQKLGSLAWLSPFPEVWGDTTLLTHKNKEYTAGQFFDFLRDNIPSAASTTVPIFENLVQPLEIDYLSAPPPVPVWLVTCEANATIIGINYVSPTEYTPILESSEPFGDNVVPYLSLHANDAKWGLKENENNIKIAGATHNNIVSNLQFIQVVQRILTDFTPHN